MKRVRSILFAAVTGVSVQVAIAASAGDALPQLPPGQSLGIALGIPTVPNLRDVGGYQGADGKTVARGTRAPRPHGTSTVGKRPAN